MDDMLMPGLEGMGDGDGVNSAALLDFGLEEDFAADSSAAPSLAPLLPAALGLRCGAVGAE
jgi:hypothetical protein